MSALLRLYPAVYRREFGDEIADSYREATAGAGRPARLREAVDVVCHALRRRLGPGSAGRAGRFLAALAPFAVIALAVNAMTWTRLSVPALRTGRQIDDIGPSVLMGAAGLAMLLGAVLALTGRWAVGVCTAPEVLLAGLPFVVLGAFSGLLDLLLLPALGLLLAASTTVAVRRRSSAGSGLWTQKGPGPRGRPCGTRSLTRWSENAGLEWDRPNHTEVHRTTVQRTTAQRTTVHRREVRRAGARCSSRFVTTDGSWPASNG